MAGQVWCSVLRMQTSKTLLVPVIKCIVSIVRVGCVVEGALYLESERVNYGSACTTDSGWAWDSPFPSLGHNKIKEIDQRTERSPRAHTVSFVRSVVPVTHSPMLRNTRLPESHSPGPGQACHGTLYGAVWLNSISLQAFTARVLSASRNKTQRSKVYMLQSHSEEGSQLPQWLLKRQQQLQRRAGGQLPGQSPPLPHGPS